MTHSINDLRIQLHPTGCQSKGQSPRPIRTDSIDRKVQAKGGIIDIHWYPEENKLVFDKNGEPNVVVDLNSLAPTTQKIKKNILAWDMQNAIHVTTDAEGNEVIENTPNPRRVIIPKDTPIDEAIQILAHEFEHNFVWSIWRE